MRIFFKIIDQHKRLGNAGANRHSAMRFHQGGGPVAKNLIQPIRHFRIINRVWCVKYRHRIYQRALGKYRQIINADHGQEGRPFRVRVDNGIHLRTRPINAGMKMKFQRRVAITRKQIARKINLADILGTKLAALA